MANIAPLKAEHVAAMFRGEKPPVATMTGYALVDDQGDPQLIFGLALFDSQHLLFMRASDELRATRRSIATRRAAVQCISRVRKMVQGVRAPVRALADPDYENSAELLEHIGFQHLNGRIYQWPQHSRT